MTAKKYELFAFCQQLLKRGEAGMSELERQDFVLIELAKKAAKVGAAGTGAALRCGSGKIYTGVAIAGMYGACAEIIALGTAKASGETDFECMAAVGGEQTEQIRPPCGNCRQLLLAHAPRLEVILHIAGSGAKRFGLRELLPHSS